DSASFECSGPWGAGCPADARRDPRGCKNGQIYIDTGEREASIGRGGSFLRFTVGTRGAGAAHVAYISRTSAVTEREENGGGVSSLIFQGLPEELVRTDTFEELREN